MPDGPPGTWPLLFIVMLAVGAVELIRSRRSKDPPKKRG
jgi:hypothetical protein